MTVVRTRRWEGSHLQSGFFMLTATKDRWSMSGMVGGPVGSSGPAIGFADARRKAVYAWAAAIEQSPVSITIVGDDVVLVMNGMTVTEEPR